MPSPPDIRGEVLDGRYRVGERIGSGGFGTVHAAEHVITGRMFAIKVLTAEHGRDAREADRLVREARTTARIDHENVVDIVDVGRTAAGALYFSMELLKGHTLEALLAREGRLAWPRARGIVRQICAALRAAHAQGVVHRDLKPANIFLVTRLGNPDVVKILDFGIAKLLRPEDERPGAATSRHEIVGTPLYMAPEQAAGDHVDARTDMYALGVILFEMLGGRRPFSGATPVALLTNILRGDPPRLGDVAPDADIPADVEAFVATALARDRGDRFADMDAMIAAIPDADGEPTRPATSQPRNPLSAAGVEPLAETLAARPASVRAPSSPRPATGMTTRHDGPRRTPWILAGVLAVAASAAAFYLMTRPSDDEAPLADAVVYQACKIRITGNTPGLVGQKITEAWIELDSGETHTLKVVGGRELVFSCEEKRTTGTLVVRFENRVGYRFPNVLLYPERETTELAVSAGKRDAPASRPRISGSGCSPKLSLADCRTRCEADRLAESCHDLATRTQRDGQPGVANKLFERACDLDHGPACAALGANLDRPTGAPARDPGRALALYDRACTLGDSWGCFNAAMTILGGGDHRQTSTGWARLDDACDLGNARACNAIGVAWRRGEFGQRIDHAAARAAFTRACELADPLGSFKGCGNLAELLSAQPAEHARARQLAETACAASSPDECHSDLFGHAYALRCQHVATQACLLLAHMLENGLGGPADPARARQLVTGRTTNVAYAGEAAY